MSEKSDRSYSMEGRSDFLVLTFLVNRSDRLPQNLRHDDPHYNDYNRYTQRSINHGLKYLDIELFKEEDSFNEMDEKTRTNGLN